MRNAEAMPVDASRDSLELELLHIIDDRDVTSVLKNFSAVEPLLAPAGLAHVLPFWRTYGAVSKRVNLGLGTGQFARDDDVAKTLPIFYNQARKPLLAYVQNQPLHMAPEWRRSLYNPTVLRAAPGIQFLMHMNAHINNDLARALDMSGVDEDYKRDFTTIVGTILESVAYEHAPEYIPLGSAQLRRFVLQSCLKYIAVAREKAWRDGKSLQQLHSNERRHADKVEQIERSAVQQGKLLLFAGATTLRAAAGTDTVASRLTRKA